MDVKGRVALVTGAASGIGKSCAVELLNEGAMVSKKKKKGKRKIFNVELTREKNFHSFGLI